MTSLLVYGCSDPINNVSQQLLMSKMAQSEMMVLLDVRSTKEYEQGHILSAINIPHQEIEKRIADLGQVKSKNIIVYCRSGARAAMAQEVLIKNGFTNVEHLKGDFPAWQESHLPVEY